MTDRVKRMKESLRISKYPLCVELFRLANESLEKTGGEPMLLAPFQTPRQYSGQHHHFH